MTLVGGIDYHITQLQEIMLVAGIDYHSTQLQETCSETWTHSPEQDLKWPDLPQGLGASKGARSAKRLR